MKADAATEAAVMSVLNQFADAYKNRDLNQVLAVFAPDPDTILIGTGADEKRIGRDEIKAQTERDWSQSDAASFDLSWTHISAAGAVAWLASDGAVNARVGDQSLSLPVRFTAVLQQRQQSPRPQGVGASG